jgi:hypothetical protein
LKNLQKVYFKFIASLHQVKFGLNAFESLILKLKSLFENCEKDFFAAHYKFGPLAIAAQLIFLIFLHRPSHSPKPPPPSRHATAARTIISHPPALGWS